MMFDRTETVTTKHRRYIAGQIHSHKFWEMENIRFGRNNLCAVTCIGLKMQEHGDSIAGHSIRRRRYAVPRKANRRQRFL